MALEGREERGREGRERKKGEFTNLAAPVTPLPFLPAFGGVSSPPPAWKEAGSSLQDRNLPLVQLINFVMYENQRGKHSAPRSQLEEVQDYV